MPLTVVIGLLLLAGWSGGCVRWSSARWRCRPWCCRRWPRWHLLASPTRWPRAILPSLLAAYTLATLLHLYAGVQRAQAVGRSRALCVDRALAETLQPGAFNVLTTGAGLLSLVLVPIPPIQVFGVAGASVRCWSS